LTHQKTISYWKLDDEDIPFTLKEKILESLRDGMYEDDWFAQDEYLCEPDVFHGFVPTSYDIGYTQSGNFIQFEFGNDVNGFGVRYYGGGYNSHWQKRSGKTQGIKTPRGTLGAKSLADSQEQWEKLREWLEIPKSTWKKIDVDFVNDEHNNTSIEFEFRAEDGENLLSDDMYGDGSYTWDAQTLLKEGFYSWDITFVQNAMIKFDKMMDNALDNLEKAYEYQCSDENIIEMAEANDYEFDENGNQI
jgi:hypothetical protein